MSIFNFTHAVAILADTTQAYLDINEGALEPEDQAKLEKALRVIDEFINIYQSGQKAVNSLPLENRRG